MRKWFLRIFLAALMLWIGYRVHQRFYYKYFLTNLTLPYSLEEQWEPSPYSPEIESILSQNFKYLSQGAQAYALASEDGNYILKIFHYRHYKKLSKKDKLINTLNGYTIAYQFLPNESGIIYQQLSPDTGLDKSVNVADRLGFSHSIDLRKVRYIIQKRAAPPHKSHYEQIIALIDKERQLGLYDGDKGVLHNIGFQEDQVIHFDLGKLRYDPGFCESEAFEIHKSHILARFPK